MNWNEIEAYIGMLLGVILVTIGVNLALESWTVMHQIEAQGVVGQAFNQEAYEDAANRFRFAGTAAAVGFALLIGGAVEYVSATLEELSS